MKNSKKVKKSRHVLRRFADYIYGRKNSPVISPGEFLSPPQALWGWQPHRLTFALRPLKTRPSAVRPDRGMRLEKKRVRFCGLVHLYLTEERIRPFLAGTSLEALLPFLFARSRG